MEKKTRIKPEFLTLVGNAFARGDGGLTGPTLGRLFSEYAVRFDVNIPFPEGPGTGTTKLDTFLRNIEVFTAEQQYLIIHELSLNPAVERRIVKRDALKPEQVRAHLVSDYSHFDKLVTGPRLDRPLIDETKHWLHPFVEVQQLYERALSKYGSPPFERNLLDDLRLAFEALLRAILNNKKPLEKQVSEVGKYIKDKGGSKEFRNMLETLITYYSNYQNTYVKHNDAVLLEEVDFILELSSSFMKYLAKVSAATD